MGFTYFGRSHACPVCDCSAPDCDCRVNGDGLHFCHTLRDESADPPGFAFRGLSANGQWGLWAEQGRCRPRARHAPRSAGGVFVAPPRVRREDSRFFAILTHSEPLCEVGRSALASTVGLPESAVDAYSELRSDGNTTYTRPAYTMPEWGYDDNGRWVVVAMHVREQDGRKRTHGDPDVSCKRGLACPPGWDRGGPLYVVEGATDALALGAMGLSALGRPSNSGGGPTLARLLRDHPGREVVVIAENDRKPDGRWPGREGAERVAAEVANLWGQPARVASLPCGFKDVREWFVGHWHRGTDPAKLADAFTRMIRADVRVFRPGPTPARADDRPSTHFAAMAALFASLPAVALPDDQCRAYEAALAERQAADRRDHRRHHCGSQRPLCQRHKATHQPRTVWVRCEKWTCTGCRSYLIARETRNAAFRLGSADSLYEFGCDASRYEAVARRLRRAGAEYAAVRDGEGWYVVCSRRVTGSIPATPETALACFAARLGEWHGPNRPVKTSHGWRLPRGEEGDGSHESVLSLPVGTTHEQVAEVASRFKAYSRRQMRPTASRVQQVAEWVRDEPWSEGDSRNFFVSLAADLGGVPEARDEAYPDREFFAVPW